MTQNSWKNASNGTWSTAGSWVGGVPNSITADATIAIAGTYTVTLAANTSYIVDSVTVSDGTANFALLGTLSLGGTLATYLFDGNKFTLGSAGTLSGGTLDIDSGTLINQGGVLATSDFILGGAASIALGGKALTIGNAALLDGYINGNNSAGSVLVLSGNAALNDFTVFENKATLVDAGTITQISQLDMGATATDSTAIVIDAGAVYEIEAQVLAAIGNTTITNAGLFEASGASTDTAAFNNTGTILALSGSDLILQDGGSIGGTLTGAGEIALDTGLFTLAPSIAINVATFGVGGTVVLGNSLSSTGGFILYQGGTLELNGNNVTLGGNSTLQDGNLQGAGTLKITGTDTQGRLYVGNNAVLEDAGTIIQSDYLQLGNTAADPSALQIDAGAVYIIENTTGYGSGGNDVITNAGLFEADGGGTSFETIFFNNTGTILATSGSTLQLNEGGSLAGTLAGAGEIDLQGGIFSLSPTIAINVAAIGIAGTADLGANLTYGGAFDLDSGNLLLNGFNATLTGAADLGAAGTLSGPGTLKLTGHDVVSALNLTGGAVLEDAGTLTQTSNLELGLNGSDSATLQIDAKAVYDIENQGGEGSGLLAAGNASIVNAGLLELTGFSAQNNQRVIVEPNIKNTGTIADLVGGFFDFAGSLDNDGLITVSSSVEITADQFSVDGSLYADTGKSGTIVLGANSFLITREAVASNETFDLTGGGTAYSQLTIDDLTDFAGTISGFATGDYIDLGNVQANGYIYANNILTLTELQGGVTSVVGDLALNNVTGTIGLITDGSGGTAIVLNNSGTSYSNPNTTTSQSTWTGKNAAWTTVADWSPSGLPGTLSTAILGGTSKYTVTYAITDAVYQLVESDASAKLTISSGNLTVEDGGYLYGTLAMTGGTFDAASTFDFSGQENVGSAATLEIDAGPLLFEGGNATLAGTIIGNVGGQGWVDFSGGNVLLNTGFALDTPFGFITGADVTLGTNLSIAVPFDLYSGILDLNGNNLTLSGTDVFGQGTGTFLLEGAGTLAVTGTAQLAGLDLADNASLLVSGFVKQENPFSIGSGGSDSSSVSITSTGIYDLDDNGAVDSINDSGTGSLINAGLLEVTGYGNDVMSLDLPVLNAGSILVAEGTLQLEDGGTLNGTISGAGVLVLSGGTFFAGSSLTANIANFEIGEGSAVLSLSGHTVVLSGQSDLSSGAQIDGAGTLKISGNAEFSNLSVADNAVIEDAGDIQQNGYLYLGYDEFVGTNATDTSSLLIDAGATYALVASSITDYGVETVINHGLLEAGGGVSIYSALVSSGTVLVNNSNLYLQYGGILSGTLAGSGTVVFIGENTLTSVVASVATMQIQGDVTLGSNLVYGGYLNDISGNFYLNGHNATLSSQGLLAGNIVGPGTLKVTGNVVVNSANGYAVLASGAVLEDAGTLGLYTSYAPLYLGSTGGDLGYLNIDAGHMFNLNAGEIYSGGAGSVTNNGLLSANPGAGANVTIEALLVNSKTGTIAVASGELSLQGGGTLAGTLTGPGELDLNGGFFTLVSGAAINAATLSLEAQASLSASLTYAGNFQENGGSVDLDGHVLTLSSQSTLGGYAAGPGTLKITGTAALTTGPSLDFYLESGAVLEIANTLNINSAQHIFLGNGDSGYLNIDAGAVVNFTAGNIFQNGGGSVTNNGLLLANTVPGIGAVINAPFTESSTGTVAVTSGELQFQVSPINLNNGTLAGGLWEAFATGTNAGTISFDTDPALTTDAANIILSGTGSEILTGSAQASIESSLVSITTKGTLQNIGRSFKASTRLVNSGHIVLGGGTFSPTSIVNSGTIAGYGTLGAVVANSGTIIASGGTLVVTKSVTGSGTLALTTASDLVLQSKVAATDKIDFTGTSETLTLVQPATMLGAIAGITLGDTIDITGTSVTSTSLTGTLLAITLAGGGVVTETLASALNGERFAITSDGNGGSDLTLFRTAIASLTPTTVAFGQHHVGDIVSATGLTLSNSQINDGNSEDLDASFAGAGIGIITNGTVSLLSPGGSSNNLTLGIVTTSAGAIAGNAFITLSTDGTGVDGDGVQGIGTDTVAVTGAFFNLATAALGSTTVALGAHHVGDVVTGFVTLSNSAAAGLYSEGLDAAFSGTSFGAGSFSDSGSVLQLAAGASSGNVLAITLGTGIAGAISGSTTLGLQSDGTGIDTLGTTVLGGQTIAVTGTAFAYASPVLTSSSFNLGIMHAGDSLSRIVTLTDASANTAYTEALDAAFLSSSGATDAGSINLLGAGLTNNTSLSVGLTGAGNGAISGTATLGLTSDGTNIDGLGTTVLGPQTITLTGTVDNYASVAVEKVSGTGILSVKNATSYLLNLGSIAVGTGSLVAGVGVLNSATGIADLLGGKFTSIVGAGFTNTGLGSFSGLGAGQADILPLITLSGATAGTFSEFITISSTGSNASGYSGALTKITLDVTGIVTSGGQVPKAKLSTAANLALAPIDFINTSGDVFKDKTARLNHETLQHFGPKDVLDITDLAPASAKLHYSGTAAAGRLSIAEAGLGVVATVTFAAGSKLSASLFHVHSDGHGGSLIG